MCLTISFLRPRRNYTHVYGAYVVYRGRITGTQVPYLSGRKKNVQLY